MLKKTYMYQKLASLARNFTISQGEVGEVNLR
jgi:hypothetical protein